MGPAQSPVQWVLGPLSPGLKWPEGEVDYSCAFRAEVQDEWSCTSAPSPRPHGMNRNSVTFYLWNCLFLISLNILWIQIHN